LDVFSLGDFWQKKGLHVRSEQSSTASMALLGGKNWRNSAAVSFPKWREALELVVTPEERETYVGGILGFLRHCKSVRAPATIMRAKVYIEAREKQEKCRLESLRVALRWFFRTAGSKGCMAKGGGDAVVPPEPGRRPAHRGRPRGIARSRLRWRRAIWAGRIGSAI
jgi:hypothetical protein